EDITYTIARRSALVVISLALLALRLVGNTCGLVGIGTGAALVEESAAVGDLGHVDLGVGDGGKGRGNEDELHLDGINIVNTKSKEGQELERASSRSISERLRSWLGDDDRAEQPIGVSRIACLYIHD